MATYKVIQDIEAEDKFLGPLTLKQFIFAAGGAVFGYLSFLSVMKGAPFLLAVFVPPMLLGLFLAIPWSSEQSTEIWVLAKLRFLFKPKSRIWDQTGLEELVTVTVPKKEEKQLTNGLDPTEVQSRLKALAETIDTRGWAIKNSTLSAAYPDSSAGERLINLDSIPKVVPDVDVNSYEDMLDGDNAVAATFDHMIQQSSMIRKQQSLEKMDRIRNGEPLNAIQQPEVHFTPPPDPYQQPATSVDEATLAQQLRNNRQASELANHNLHRVTLYPDGHVDRGDHKEAEESEASPEPAQTATQANTATDDNQAQAPMTTKPNPAIVEFVDNNDLNVDTIARQLKKPSEGDNEVVISLR